MNFPVHFLRHLEEQGHYQFSGGSVVTIEATLGAVPVVIKPAGWKEELPL